MSQDDNMLGMGALPPPGMDWMEGRTAGDIALIGYVMRTRAYLNNPTEAEKKALLHEANDLLMWLKVEGEEA